MIATVALSTSAIQIAATGIAHAAGCDTWYGPGGGSSNATSGIWGVPSNWSTGSIPGGSDDVCITVPGTYTVTLAPWSLGTADPNHAGDGVNALTLGAPSGAQTLDIYGEAGFNDSNETVNTVELDLASSSTINANGTLILDSTNGVSQTGQQPVGASSVISGGPLLNYGHIVTQVEDTGPGAGTYLSIVGFVNEHGASLNDNTGTLTVGDINTSSATNQGTVVVAKGASMVVTPNSFSSSIFTNESTVTNNGSITVNNASWSQSAGSITGNTVTLQSGAVLVDAAGPARFVANYGTVTLNGTIPKSQTITVLGEPYNYQGETYYSSTVTLGGTQVVNNGHIVLEADGKSNTTGGSVYLIDGGLVNNGTVAAKVVDPSWAVHLQVGVTNHHSGSLSVSGGQLLQDTATKTANSGHVTIAANGSYVLDEGASFANAKSATTTIQIAGAKKYGQFGLAGPCCAGPGVFVARGTLSPVLVHGYRPAANKDFAVISLEGGKFEGRFHSVARKFTADYKSEAASPAFVGAKFR